MAMTPEAKVKKKCVAVLKELNCYYFFPATGGYGKSGVPDIILCYTGLFVGIECKAGKGKTTALQDMNLRDIRAAGGLDLVINELNVDKLKELIVGWGHKMT